MPTIDDRVVSLSFEGDKFKQGVNESISLLDQLNQKLKFHHAGEGLDSVGKAAGNMNLSSIADNVDHISSRFSALGAVGFTVIQDLTNGFIHLAKRAGGDILGPIISGGKQRALNIEQAKFQFRGLHQNVTRSMASALAAVKGTAFGLDEAAKTAAQFGAAGITAGKQMTGALKGVAGIAALTNTHFGDISQIFTTIAGAGKINSEQLYQFATRGINIAAALAKQLHVTEAQVRQMVTQGQITFPVFAKAMDDAFGKHAKEANQTFQGALANMRAALARIGADAWTPFLKASRNVFNTLGPFFDRVHEAIQPLLDAFGVASLSSAAKFNNFIRGISLAGLTKSVPHVLAAIKNIFKALGDIVRPMREAFRDIFPPTTTRNVVGFAKSFEALTKRLIPSKDTIENIRRSFRGFFAVLDIGKMIVLGIVSVFEKMLKAVGVGSGGFLNFTGSLGDFLVALDKSLKQGHKLANFFDKLGNILSKPAAALGAFVTKLESIFQGHKIGNLRDELSPLQKILEGIGHAFHSLGESLKNIDFTSVFTILSVAFITGITLFIKKAFSGGALSGKLVEGIFASILRAPTLAFRRAMNQATLALEGMQAKVKSEAIKNIAIAVALLAASIIGLALVDPKRLNGAISAITLMMGELLGMMKLMENLGKGAVFARMPIVAASMIILATAIDTLAIAVAILSRLSWDQLKRGLAAITVLLTTITASALVLSKNSGGLIAAGIGINAIAVAMNILAEAVKTFGSMDLKTLGKGIGAIAASLVAIGAAANLFPSGMIAMGLGLIAIGTALELITKSVETLGRTNMKVLGKGIGAIAVALAAIGLAMQLMPGPSMVLTAAGLILVGIALEKITGVISELGHMSIKTLAKGIVSLAAAMLILALGLNAMTGTLAGAAALLIAAAAIAILAPALESLGKQSWGEIIKGLVALAAAFALLGAAGLILAPVTPAVLALGIALLAIGGGLALAGVGIALIGVGLSAIALAGPAAFAIITNAIVHLAKTIPVVMVSLAKGLIGFLTAITDAAPKFVSAVVKIVVLIADGIIKAAPKVANAAIAIITALLKVIHKKFPDIVKMGFEILVNLLSGLRDNISRVTHIVASIITRFLNALANRLPRIVHAGARIVIKLVEGIGNNLEKLIEAGAKMIGHIITGVGRAAEHIAKSGIRTAVHFIVSMAKEIPKQVDRIASAVIRMLNKLAGVIRKREPEFIDALFNIGEAIAEGIIKGLEHGLKKLPGIVKHIAGSVIKSAKHGFGIFSPSREFHDIGVLNMLGLANGLTEGSKHAVKTSTRTASNVVQAVRDTLSSIPDMLDTSINLDPVISPVLDLSSVHAEAKKIPDLSAKMNISADASFAHAVTISSEKATIDQTHAEAAKPPEKPSVTFNQHNTSPEALSTLEIYRRTNNQVSQIKSALGAPA